MQKLMERVDELREEVYNFILFLVS